MSIAEKLTTIAENEQRVYKAGKQKEWSNFWDDLQKNGTRTDYSSAFYGAWTEKTFKPKYPIRAKDSAAQMLYSLQISDFEQHCLDNNIVIDVSQTTSVDSMLYSSITGTIPESLLDISNASSAQRYVSECRELIEVGIIQSSFVTNFNRFFYNCTKLTTIGGIDVSKATNVSNMFSNCYALTEISFSGTIPISISFSSSPLSLVSTKNVINHLKDYSGTTTTYTLTLHADSKAELGESDIAIATQKGWTLA